MEGNLVSLLGGRVAEEITFNELTFKIEETVNNRINRLRITINEAR